MEILLWASDASDVAVVIERLERDLAKRLDWVDIRRDPYDSAPDVVVIALRPGETLDHHNAIAATLRRADERTVPLFVMLFKGATAPKGGRLTPALRSLEGAPTVAPEDLADVLQYVAQADRARARLLTVRPRPVRRASGRPTLVRRIRHDLARRDQVLLKISGSSTVLGLAILATLGGGGASLFFFVGAVTFLLSSPPD